MISTVCRISLVLLLILFTCVVQADPTQEITVDMLSFQPTIDGDLSEWPIGQFQKIRIRPAVKEDKKNNTGMLTVEFAVGIYVDSIYVAVRWPDKSADTHFRPWVWRVNKYRRSKERDDMFALRFEHKGDYQRTMIADTSYEADVWVWSAGRSNLIAYATDYKHVISLDLIEDAAEYKTERGNTVYIDKQKDSGSIGYKTLRPAQKNKTKDELPSITISELSTGSIADVKAKGIWQSGFWHLEMVRKLNTGHDDDTPLQRGQAVLGQIAVFNNANEEHKSISEPISFKLVK